MPTDTAKDTKKLSHLPMTAWNFSYKSQVALVSPRTGAIVRPIA